MNKQIRFYPGDGAGPLRSTLLLRPHSHCGPKGRRPQSHRPVRGRGGKKTSRSEQSSWVTKVRLQLQRARQNIRHVFPLILAPRTWPAVTFWARVLWTGASTPSPSRYVIDWGVCRNVCADLTEFRSRRTLPYALCLTNNFRKLMDYRRFYYRSKT